MQKHCKRKLPRFEHGNLIVKVKKTGFISKLFPARIVSWLDFHKQGIAFISDQRYSINTLLELDLSITDKYQIKAQNIAALVKNCQIKPEGYRYGLEFDFESNNYMRTDQVKSKIISIEQLLKEIYFKLTGKTSFRTG